MPIHTLYPAERGNLKLSFEYFPPKNDDMEVQLFETVADLSAFDPAFVTMTYGAGGSTKARSLTAVRRMIHDEGIASTAAHLTCVGAAKAEVDAVVAEFIDNGVRHFVALRGDPQGGIGVRYEPFPDGYENAAALVSALRAKGDFEISVSAYPEKHPESRDTAADIDMLKRKADNGADRALTQFFFDNDNFERYLERVRGAGISIPVVPGIMPIQNLTQLKRFAGACGTIIPTFLDERFAGFDDKPEERAKVAAEVAAEQIEDLVRRGIHDFHLYTMNRAPLVSAVLDNLGLSRRQTKSAGAAA